MAGDRIQGRNARTSGRRVSRNGHGVRRRLGVSRRRRFLAAARRRSDRPNGARSFREARGKRHDPSARHTKWLRRERPLATLLRSGRLWLGARPFLFEEPAREVTRERLWRVRKRQQSVDAVVREIEGEVTLEFVMNGKRVTARNWPSRAQAIKAATEKRKELERAGWATQWEKAI